MMRLDINFREVAYRRAQRSIAVVYSCSVLMLLAASYLFTDYLRLASLIGQRESGVSALKEEQARLADRRAKLKPVATELNRDFVDYEVFLGRYIGRLPDEILYDLEKTVPEGVTITHLTYDRVTGVALVNAVSDQPEHVTKILRTLEQVADYSRVMLSSQSETEEKGKTKFVFKIVDDGKVERDET